MSAILNKNREKDIINYTILLNKKEEVYINQEIFMYHKFGPKVQNRC